MPAAGGMGLRQKEENKAKKQMNQSTKREEKEMINGARLGAAIERAGSGLNGIIDGIC